MNEKNANGRQLVAPAETQGVPSIRDPYRTLTLYGGTGENAQEAGLNILHYWRILNRHKWLILSITAAFIALATVRTLMQTPLYSATVRLQIDRNVAKIINNESVTPAEDDYNSDFMQTQYELLQGPTMAERVASALKLGND